MNKKLLKQIKEQVRTQVSSVFSDEDISVQKRALEDLLEESAQKHADLLEQVAAKETEIADYISKVEDAESKIQTLETELASLKTDSETASSDLATIIVERDALKAELDEMKKQAALASRVKELETSGVLRSGESAEKQLAYIQRLSDDEFVEYKDHLIETKAELEATIKAALTQPKDPKEDASVTDPVVGKELASIHTDVKLSDEVKAKYASFFDTKE